AAMSTEKWERFRDLLEKRLSFAEEASNQHARFCFAWALFQCKQFQEAREQFRLLDQQTLSGRYRVDKLAIWCDSSGRPNPCTGTIRFISDESDRGDVYCPQTRMEIAFKPKEFGENLQRDDPLDTSGFHIAFNFRGPTADPRRFFKREEEHP